MAVIDDDVFESVFAGAVRFNEEGEIVGAGDSRADEGVPFTAGCVDRMLTGESVASPGAACLALAWQQRACLLP